MARYRDGVVQFEDASSFLAEDKNFRAAAMACSLEAGTLVPALRQVLRIDVLVEGWRCGPLKAEVVHVNGTQLGLHLSDDAVSQLRQLGAQLTQRQRRLTEVFRATAAELVPRADNAADNAAQSPEAQRAGLESEPLLGDSLSLTGQEPWLGEETGEVYQLSGALLGAAGLGLLNDFLDESALPPPPQSDTTLLYLLRYFAQAHASGSLTVRGQTFTKIVWLKRGAILAVQVSPVKDDEMLGQILIKARWVSPKDLGHALTWARNHKIGLGTSLVQSAKISQAQLDKALAHQTFRRLQDMFSWQQARFEYISQDDPPPPPYHPITAGRLRHEMAQELLRDARAEDLQLLLKAYEDRYPSLEGASSGVLKALLPSDKTRQVCERIFDGTRIVRQTIAASQLGRPKTVRLLLYLRAAGVLEMHPDPPLASVTAEATRERLRTLQLQDHFQRLSLDYSPCPEDIGPAHRERVACFGGGKPFHRADAAGAKQVAQLLSESFQVLDQPHLRRAHRLKVLGHAGVARLRELRNEELALARIHANAPRVARLQRIVDDLATS